MDRLLLYQDARLEIAATDDKVYLEGTLTINVKGVVHWFTVKRFTVEDAVVALEDKLLKYDWSEGRVEGE